MHCNSLGFDWGTTVIGWEGHFEKLVQFKELHGHCRVPQNHTADDVNLGNWVKKQRQEYQKFEKGQKSQITQERIDQLNSIGFDWGTTVIGWEGTFEKLVQFKELHGHCQVPQNYSVDDANLGTWVNTQRRYYREYLAGKYSPMTQERIDALESLGFVWKGSRWEANFRLLEEFQKENGHCRVPRNHSVDDVNLGTWVITQRQNYRNYLAGKYSPLTQERIDQLNSVGFDWGIFMTDWKGTFEKLVQFKEAHGHCRVPIHHSVDNVNLGRWVNTQRNAYKSFKDGKDSPMTQERIDALEKIGFEWKGNIGFEDHFQKLVQYKESHGHCRVPKNYAVDDVNLGNWVYNSKKCIQTVQGWPAFNNDSGAH